MHACNISIITACTVKDIDGDHREKGSIFMNNQIKLRVVPGEGTRNYLQNGT